VKLLIDECLHTSLVELAHAAGHLAHHVNYLGLGSSKDWQLMATIRAQEPISSFGDSSYRRSMDCFADGQGDCGSVAATVAKPGMKRPALR
jgi:predicted nuclease of predicted toxin-antitoxin system